MDQKELLQRYHEYYDGEPLVRVMEDIPEVRDINRCNQVCIGGFGVSRDRNHVVMTSTIDNLRKGAASAALQNINLMLGIPEFSGIQIRSIVSEKEFS